MTPQEKFEREVWWLLREIQKESFVAPVGKPLEFDLRVQRGKQKLKPDEERPNEETQRRILYKLRDEKIIKVERRPDVFDYLGTTLGKPLPVEFYITILQSKFDQAYQSFEKKFGHSKPEKTPIPLKIVSMPKLTITGLRSEKTAPDIKLKKIKLNSASVIFNDEKAMLAIGKQICSLPPFKNEHYFCRAMFSRPVKEPVDWSLIYQEMTGGHEEMPDPKNKRTVQDTMYALNNRIKEVANTDDALFTWENKSIKRNF